MQKSDIIGKYFPVLDNYGFISLVDYMGDDEDIEQAARLSYQKGTRKLSDTRNLLRYLMRHKHTSPTEFVQLKFHISMPIFVHRQLVRHRASCLHKDTKVYFDEPAKAGKDERGKKISYATIADLYEKYHNGAKPITSRFGSVIRMPMQKIIENRYIRCCNEENQYIEHTHVNDIIYSGKKDIFEVETENGYKIKCSKDHLFLTNNGWMTLEKLARLKISRNGAVVFYDDNLLAVNGVELYNSKDWLATQRASGLNLQQIADLAGCSKHTIRKMLKKYDLKFTAQEKSILSGKQQRGQKRPNNKKQVYKDRDAWLINVRKARCGENSNFWKGGITLTDRRINNCQKKTVYKRDNYKCIICQSNKKPHAHHIDPVFNNPDRINDIYNLTTVCDACHKMIHNNNLEFIFKDYFDNLKDFSTFFLDNGKEVASPLKLPKQSPKMKAHFVKIKNIQYIGIDDTYDISVDGPWHNFVADGFIVHNSMNEASGRYSVLPTYTYFPSHDNFGVQSNTNKQGRDEILNLQHYQGHKVGAMLQNSLAKQNYQNMLNDNVARELARINLPLSIYTEFYWSINLHNLFHFLKLRCDSHAQYEIRQYARIMASIIKLTHPLSFEAWYDYSHKSFNWTRLDQILFNKTRYLTDEENDYEKSVYSIGESIGMSKREIEEHFMKIRMPQDDDFSLDLSTAKTAEHYHNIRNEVTNGEEREVNNQISGETT